MFGSLASTVGGARGCRQAARCKVDGSREGEGHSCGLIPRFRFMAPVSGTNRSFTLEVGKPRLMAHRLRMVFYIYRWLENNQKHIL